MEDISILMDSLESLWKVLKATVNFFNVIEIKAAKAVERWPILATLEMNRNVS